MGGGRQGVLKKNKNARGHFGKGMIRRGASQELTKVMPLKFKKKKLLFRQQGSGVSASLLGYLGVGFNLLFL